MVAPRLEERQRFAARRGDAYSRHGAIDAISGIGQRDAGAFSPALQTPAIPLAEAGLIGLPEHNY
ncbi:hypothetical protein [Burkholderia cenocepacia]|uniref:hypothetical protein n=1 Tax=Burkholderia cenocepacia TaxID=95486 RepID=UPI002AB7553C|nr:hypothetical protein [Burkholderia cenocepacia]